ncbi:MAG: hybrid sensor histidine kinase/response regulator [Acidobacteria bacterium]|nr:MAG: hybrid sensor histidine kinase/response regulator [Acidobacteriota bacterium]
MVVRAELGSDHYSQRGQEQTRSRLRHIERREWWLWATAVMITLLLTAGILSFLPMLLQSNERSDYFFTLRRAMWGLLGMVLLFDVYTVYQQLQIHRMRRRLFEREELFRLISDNAADMIAVVDMDGNRIYNSQSYSRVLGYDEEELKHSSSFEQVHPDDREMVRRAAEDARRSGVGRTLEYRIRHKDGSWRVLESTASVIRTPRGEPQKLVIVNRDITERKKAAESLRQSESGFRSMVEDAPYGIFRCHSNGKLLSANPAFQRMLRYDHPDELLQTNLVEDVFESPSEFERLKNLVDDGKEFKDVAVELRRKDGNKIAVRCRGRSVTDPEGLPSLDVFAEVVTEKRILERQLQMAAKMEAVGRLSGGVAHDFNNLLGVIIGYSQLFKRKLDPQSPLREHAEEIEKAGQRAAALTRQLLAFSRQQVLTPAVLNLNDLVADMLKMLPRLIGEDIAVSTSLAADLGRVKADHGQIEQVIMNLAVNARDAMPSGGQLRIETANRELDQGYVRHHPGARPGQYVMLSVADSGTGIDAETLAHIFEPFFTTKELGKGTGLGLATVYGVVKQSEGYVWVDSEPGKGASFQIFLPRVEEEQTAQLPIRAQDGQGAGASQTILLVEDSEPLRKLTRSFLESHGFDVLVAQNGEEAIDVEARSSKKIHLLVTDVVMPGINGRVLAERLHLKQREMKVLYISGYTDSFIASHGVLERGMTLLNKPYTEDELVQKVRETLRRGAGEGNDESLPARSQGRPPEKC